ncbi:secreted signal peptide protein [Xanthomonas euvesicatoria]|uniref:secreted signal peptide protein n=1 Tax=Xanthomonas euvesicatoria TaxID=456327 RepID=UPI001C468751|nr:secreted signal peptide protein [Xanthomonas euvesicatoria]MBV6895119.1 secreted signal peptide protein [Xanthomonas campestris pv. ionidii]
MPRHSLLFCGLLLFGLVAPPSRAASNDGKACSRALHLTFITSASATTLPAACAHIGPLALGMRKQQVLAALGQPDVTHIDAVDPNRLSLLYLYPRDIKAQLAQHPRRAGTLVQGELAVGLRNDRVSNLIAFADQRAHLLFHLLGHPVGTHINRILQTIGGSPQWNASRDYVQFSAMPLGIDVDPDTLAIVGLNIATTKQELDNFDLPGLNLLKSPTSGLINGIR